MAQRSIPTSRVSDRNDILHLLVDVSHRLAAHGFVAATDGNVSVRLPSGNMLITPSALSKDAVTDADVVEVRSDGRPLDAQRRPSTELDMHLFVYERRPEIHAVVHAHPVHATAFAAARIPMTDAVFPEVILGLGGIPLAAYATPSTPEVRASIAPFVERANAILLANHGVLTMGRTLEEAYRRMEKVEHAAHILSVARQLGGAHRLTADELRRLQAISRAHYGIDPDAAFPSEPGT